MNDVAVFYDELAEDYSALFVDWDASVARQAGIIDRLIRSHGPPGARRLLDATCGIGTQAIGLALRGYEVVASDISPRAVDRARREALRLGARLEIDVADVRALPETAPGPFDVAISFDNALPHLVEPGDVDAALHSLATALRAGGLLLVSVRDYDALLAARPSGEPPRITGPVGTRRVMAQAWEWEPDGPVYRLHQFVLREGPPGQWATRHLETRYRAYRRDELTAAALAAGLTDAEWLEPSATGFYQPILAAHRP